VTHYGVTSADIETTIAATRAALADTATTETDATARHATTVGATA